MIYMDETLNIIEYLKENDNTLPMNDLVSNSDLKEKEARQVLSYMLYLGYIDFNGNDVITSKMGLAFHKAFGKYKNKTLNILLDLREHFPKALTKKDANPGLSSMEYRDIIWFLREKKFVEPVSNKPVHELLRITDYGFQILDLFEYRAKLNQILD